MAECQLIDLVTDTPSSGASRIVAPPLPHLTAYDLKNNKNLENNSCR
jgi:hypothetical protein